MVIIDVAVVHDFSGDVSRDVQLHHDDPDMLLNIAASVKAQKYREAYAAPDRHMVFLPAISSTSGHIHCEFVRLIYILYHRQTLTFFATFGVEPSDDAFTFRRTTHFFQLRGFLV